MNLPVDPVQTQTSLFVDMGISTINALDEGSGLSTPYNRIQKPIYGAHYGTLNHIFGENAAVGVSEENSDYDYN